MSAIVGMYHRDGRPVDPADIARMIERLAHRGPDGRNTRIDGAVALGHGMLWTTPESLNERLPLVDTEAGLTVTADARIDNRDELISTLGLGSLPAEKIPDSELILRAYERWGEACVERLLGDFAFAIWDARRRTLFCARDHFGVKPFYYHCSNRLFAFASEIKALRTLPEVPRRLNEVRVADYLVPMLEDKEITFYEEILRLPPAQTMTIGPTRVSRRTYWALDPTREIRLGSDEEYAEAFREVFTEAVRCRLRSAYPVGSMLSGGLDSSSVACVARRLLGVEGRGDLDTFSAIFEGVPGCDERRHIDAVTSQCGFRSHRLEFSDVAVLSEIHSLLRSEDEPIYGHTTFMYLDLYRVARQQGVRAILHGVDGDTVVSHGLGHLPTLFRSGRWLSLTGEVVGLGRNFGRSRWQLLWHRAVKPNAPAVVRMGWRWLRGRDVAWLVDREFAKDVRLSARLEAFGYPGRPAWSCREDHWRRLTSGSIPLEFEISGRIANGYSIDLLYPFFDVRLVDLCLALPAEQKIRGGFTRIVLRNAMAKILPEGVRLRGGKANFGRVLIDGLRGRERPRIEGVLAPGGTTVSRFADIRALRAAWRRLAGSNGESRADALEVAYALWRVLALESWIDGRVLAERATMTSGR